MHPTWQKILDACIKGDSRAQKAFYDHFKGKMYVLCQRYARSREDAEDILQEGFIRVFRDLHQYRGEGSLEGWVRKVMVRVALDFIRKEKREIATTQLNDWQFLPDDQPTDYHENEMMAKHLIRLMQKLPEGFRTVLNLYILEGYSHAEIAELLDISVGTSKSQLNRAKKALRQLLEKSLTK